MKTRHARERGIVLVSALIILTTLTLIVITVAFRNTSNELMSASQRDSVKAMTVAESGIEAGFALIRGYYVESREFEVDQLTPFISSPLIYETISGGSFSVTTPVIGTQHLVLNSLGSYAGAEREIEIIMQIDGSSTFRYAILTEDTIHDIDGTASITGPYANVHSNGDIMATGVPTVEGTVSASGTIDTTGNPDFGGEVSGSGSVEIPHVYPPEYRQFANIIFTADCRVESPEGVLIADVNADGQWYGWNCSTDDKWVMSGNSPDDLFEAFYYIEGNVELNGNPDSPWFATFVAEGYIDVSGNAQFAPWGSKIDNDTGNPSADELLFLAGNDLRVIGTAGQRLHGILAAHMEVEVSGTATLNGSIIAENGRYAMGQEITDGQQYKDLVTENRFGGTLNMTANGTAILGGGNPVKVKAWRELVH